MGFIPNIMLIFR